MTTHPRMWLLLAASAALIAGACASAPPERQLIANVAEAMGGADRLRAARALLIEGEGVQGGLGQSFAPGGPLSNWLLTDFSRAIDLENGRMRVRQTRTADFEFPLQKVQKTEAVLDGDVAFTVGANGMPARNNARQAGYRRIEMLHHPVPLLRAALADGATLSNLREEDGRQVVDIRPAGMQDVFTLAVDGATMLPARVTSQTYDPNLGDVAIVTTFAEYEAVNGLQVPRHITSTIDGLPQYDIRVTRNTVDGDIGALAAPDAVRAMPEPPVEAPATVTVEELGPGVWRLAGQSHNSVVIEFADHLTLIEAPMNETRTLAVIARARELRPGKPLRDVVVTHHHFDHTGGLRAAVSEGLTVVAHSSYEPLFRELVQRPHTVVQDVLAKNPKPLMFQGVDDALTMRDATNEVQIYNLTGNTHVQGLLMAYLPRERTLVQADVFGTYVTYPFAPNLYQHLQKRKLRVERHLPIHGPMMTQADLMKVLPSASTE